MPAPAPDVRADSGALPRRPVPAAAAPRGRGGRDVVLGALLGVGAGLLGTAAHLNLAALPGGGALPWGLGLALLLAGSTQRCWMRVVGERGGRPVPAGAAVVLAAFTVAVVLYRLPVTDRLGLPWTAAVAQALPVAFAASIGWIAGLPVLGVVLLALAGRRRRGLRAVPDVPARRAAHALDQPTARSRPRP